MGWKLSTAVMLTLMVATYAAVGGLLGYAVGLFFTDRGWIYGSLAFLALGLAVALYSYFAPVSNILRMYNAVRVTPSNEPRLYGIVEDLSRRAGIPMPSVYACDVDFSNAFALGRTPDRAAVAVTIPLLDLLSDEMLEGVMAHEISHIVHRDTIVNGTARNGSKVLCASAVVMGFIGMAALALLGGGGRSSGGGGGIVFLILMIILIPIIIVCLVLCLMVPSAAAIMRFSVSRSREYGADESAGRLTGRPAKLAEALMLMEDACTERPAGVNDPYSSNLWITAPGGRGRRKLMSRLLDSHPSTASRVERLMRQEAEMSGKGAVRAVPVAAGGAASGVREEGSAPAMTEAPGTAGSAPGPDAPVPAAGKPDYPSGARRPNRRTSDLNECARTKLPPANHEIIRRFGTGHRERRRDQHASIRGYMCILSMAPPVISGKRFHEPASASPCLSTGGRRWPSPASSGSMIPSAPTAASLGPRRSWRGPWRATPRRSTGSAAGT